MSLVDINNRNEKATKQVVEQLQGLSKVIDEIENDLLGMTVCVDVWHVYKSVNDVDHCIGISKAEGKWKLCYGRRVQGKLESVSALTSTKIHLRIEAIQHVEVLRNLIVESKEQLLEMLKSATNSLKGIN